MFFLDGNERYTVMPDTWIMYPNAYIPNGIAYGASNVADCQSSCINDSTCTSIDWDAGAADGQRCWLDHGISPGEKITHSSGITHYELRRSLVGWWLARDSTGATDAGGATAEDDLDSCKLWCATNLRVCNSVDWNPTASQGQKCLSYYYTTELKSMMGVTTYTLNRGMDGHCGK